MSSSEVAAASARVEVIDLTSEDRGPTTTTTTTAAATNRSASSSYVSSLAPSIQTLTSRRSLHSTFVPKKASAPPSMKTSTQPPSSNTSKPKPTISGEKSTSKISVPPSAAPPIQNGPIPSVGTLKSANKTSTIPPTAAPPIQNGPIPSVGTLKSANKTSTIPPSTAPPIRNGPIPSVGTLKLADKTSTIPPSTAPSIRNGPAPSVTMSSTALRMPTQLPSSAIIMKPQSTKPIASSSTKTFLPTQVSTNTTSPFLQKTSMQQVASTAIINVTSSKKSASLTSLSGLKSLPSSTSKKPSQPSTTTKTNSRKGSSSTNLCGLKSLPSSSLKKSTITIPCEEKTTPTTSASALPTSAAQIPMCSSWEKLSTSTPRHHGPPPSAKAAPPPRHHPLPVEAAPPPRLNPPPTEAAPPPRHPPPRPPSETTPPPHHNPPPAEPAPPHSETKPQFIPPPLDSQPPLVPAIKSFSSPPSSPLSMKYTLVPSPEPIMSPKVFELSPPKNESNWTSQSHHPPQVQGEFAEERLLQENLKRCRDFCSDEELTSGPDRKRLRRADSSESVSSSIPDNDTGSVVEKEAASINGKIPSKRPKKVKKLAGQRRVRKKIPQGSSELGTISFECSLEVMQKLEELFHQMCPPPPTTTEEDSPDGEKKVKEKKFSRCPSDKKYLCEVCSKKDCKKCDNCLNRSTRRQSCKEKPKEKCLTWKRKQREKEKKEKEEQQKRKSSLSGEKQQMRSSSLSREPAGDQQSRDDDTSRDGGNSGLASYPVATPEQIAIASGFKDFNGTSVSPLFEDNRKNTSDQTSSFIHVKNEVDPDETTSFKEEPPMPAELDVSIVDPDQTTSFVHVKDEPAELDVSIVDPDQTTSFVHVKDEPAEPDVSIISSHPAKTPFPPMSNVSYDAPQPGSVTETVLESNQDMPSDGEESVFGSSASMCLSPPVSPSQAPLEWSELHSFEIDGAIDCDLYSPALSDSPSSYHPSQAEIQDAGNKVGHSSLSLLNSNAEEDANDSKSQFGSPSLLSSVAHSAPSHGAEITPCVLPGVATRHPASPKSSLTPLQLASASVPALSPHSQQPASQQHSSLPSAGLTLGDMAKKENIQPSRSYSTSLADTGATFGMGQKKDLIPLSSIEAIQQLHASQLRPAETNSLPALQLNAGTSLEKMRRRTSTPPCLGLTQQQQALALETTQSSGLVSTLQPHPNRMSVESDAASNAPGTIQSAAEPDFISGRRPSSVSLADEYRQNSLPSPMQAVLQSDLVVSQPACLPHAARSLSGGSVSPPRQPSHSLPVPAGIASEDSSSRDGTPLSSQQPPQQTQTQIPETGISLDQAVEDILDKGLEEGTSVRLHITKCGVSGPPETGKSHVRALMLGQPRPLTRHSTAVATEADQATPDFQKLYDKSEYVIDMDGKGCVWRVLKDDSMARIIANTLFSKYQKDAGSYNVNPDLQTPAQAREHIRDKYKIILHVKKRLRCMVGKKDRKRKGLNGIRLVYFVDTGGQPQFQEILPNFIKCDVNLLVHNLSQELLHCPDFNFVTNGKKFSVPENMKLSNIDIIEQSVRSITSNARPYAKPSVAIVGTFKDKCSPLTYDDMLKEKSRIINERLKPYLTGRGKCELFSPKHTTDQRIFAIDGSLEGWNSNIDTLDKLKHFIDEYAAKKSIDVPIKYYIFIEILKAHATREGQQYLTLQKCKEIARTICISMTQAEIVKALELFDECNVILYFPNVLKDIAFVKPGFLFNLVTELIVASFQCESDPLSQERLHFQRTGIFSLSILRDIPSLQLSGPFTQQDFLNLMENLYIIAPSSQTGCYFMPCVLPLEDSSTVSRELADVKECMKDGKIDGPLVISFAHKISPRGLFCAILVAIVRNSSWKLSTLSEGIYRRRNLVEFEVFHQSGRHSGCSGKVIIFDKGSKLEIYTTCDRDNCSNIRQTIYSAFEEASKSLGYDKVFDSVGLPCYKCSKSVDEHCTNVYAKDNGVWKEKCLVNTNKYPVTLTPNRLIWFREDLDRAGGEDLFRVFCNEVVPRTNKWKAIGINLGLDMPRIERIERDFDRTEDCFLEVLKTWKRNGTPVFSVNTMVSILEEEIVGEICLAKSLRDKYCV